MRKGLIYVGALLAVAGCHKPESRARPEITSADIAESVLTTTKHFKATGQPPVYQALPGDQPIFADKARDGASASHNDPMFNLFGSQVAKIDGEIKVEAIDRIGEDKAIERENTEKAKDEANVSGWFRGQDGAKYEFKITKVQPAQPNGEERTHFGGVASNVLLFGDTGVGTPLLPKVKAGCAIWGIGRLERNGQLVSEELPMRVFVTTHMRQADTGKLTDKYDASQGNVDEISLLIAPMTPQQAMKPVPTTAPQTGENVPQTDRTLPAGEKKLGENQMNQGAGLEQPLYIIWGHAKVSL